MLALSIPSTGRSSPSKQALPTAFAWSAPKAFWLQRFSLELAESLPNSSGDDRLAGRIILLYCRLHLQFIRDHHTHVFTRSPDNLCHLGRGQGAAGGDDELITHASNWNDPPPPSHLGRKILHGARIDADGHQIGFRRRFGQLSHPRFTQMRRFA